MLGPVSSHTAAETRQVVASLRSQPNRWQGILETTHRTSRRYENNPRVRIRSSFRAICVRRRRRATTVSEGASPGGDLYLLAGLPGTGKYTIALALAALLSDQGQVVRVVDNHYLANPIFGLIDEDGVTPLPPDVRLRVRDVREAVTQTIEQISPRDWTVIFTHVLETPADLA
jgi:Mrp family chromosome partitioning ATPase